MTSLLVVAETVPSLAEESGPRIEAVESLIHIGDIDRGGYGEATFQIKNVGDEELRIEKVKPG